MQEQDENCIRDKSHPHESLDQMTTLNLRAEMTMLACVSVCITHANAYLLCCRVLNNSIVWFTANVQEK